MRALVIGADGFVGRHLTTHLRDAGDAVTEAVGVKANEGVDAPHIDVRDAAAVAALVREARPEAIYHLAAVAYGPDASSDLATAVAVTVGGTANVLTAAAQAGTAPVVLIPGSSEASRSGARIRSRSSRRGRSTTSAPASGHRSPSPPSPGSCASSSSAATSRSSASATSPRCATSPTSATSCAPTAPSWPAPTPGSP